MKFHPPTKEEIAEIKQTVGLASPTVPIRLYAIRGSGGFGPEYGLLDLASGHVTGAWVIPR